MMAAYALYWRAIELFAGRVRYLNLGAGAGTAAGDDGLTRFKRGWATESRPSYLAGRVLDAEAYQAAVAAAHREAGGSYFPAYREGEFG